MLRRLTFKRAVSPVVGAIILIVLVIAAGIAVWRLSQTFDDSGDVDTLSVLVPPSGSINSDRSNLTVIVTVIASSPSTFDLGSTKLRSHANGTPSGVSFASISPDNIASGETFVTIVINKGTAGSFGNGAYEISLAWNGQNGVSKVILLSFNASL